MPGLIRGVARTAVVAGTATAVSNRVSRRQMRRWGGEGADFYEQPQQQQQGYPPPQQYAPPPPAYEGPGPDSQEDKIEALRQLGSLHNDGILTDQEFEAEKRKILGS
jgi:hypothetical protein